MSPSATHAAACQRRRPGSGSLCQRRPRPAGSRCRVQPLQMRGWWALALLAGVGGTGTLAPPSASCAAGCPHDPVGCPGDLCCSLNGALVPSGACQCRKPWRGPRCELLGFRPAALPQGYGQQPQLSSWGGNALFDGTAYHLYVAAMTNNCSLSSWGSNSRIEHAVSQTVEGPYTKKSIAVNTWAHNPVVLKLPHGGYALMHIGTGAGAADGGGNCTRTASSSGGGGSGGGSSRAAAGSTIHVSATLAGPWSPLLNSTLGPCNNPSPWVHRNGTIFLVCSGGPSGNGLRRAGQISGPWSLVTPTLSAPGGVYGVYEDPYLFMDNQDHWHLLFHVYETGEPGMTCGNSTVSGESSAVSHTHCCAMVSNHPQLCDPASPATRF